MKAKTRRTVLITGVSSGIGAATASLFKKEGWRVLGIDRVETKSNKHLTKFFRVDISNSKSLESFFEELPLTTKVLNAVIHNAAVQVAKPLVDTTLDDWDDVFKVNIRSIFQSTQLSIPFLKRAGGGAIVNVSSVHAMATSKNIAAYAASKGAVTSFTRACALELGELKIRVNAVLPGAIDTPMLRAGLDRGHTSGKELQKLKQLGKRHPLGSIGVPHDIAQSILFLADNEKSNFVTGQGFIIDGGVLSHLSSE